MTTRLDEYVQDAEGAVRAFDLTIETHSKCVEALVALQMERPGQKTAALVRLCQQEHPAIPGKRYSANQAEDVLQLDPAYAAYKSRVAKAEAAVREAEDAKESARLIAEIRANAVRYADAGVS